MCKLDHLKAIDEGMNRRRERMRAFEQSYRTRQSIRSRAALSLASCSPYCFPKLGQYLFRVAKLLNLTKLSTSFPPPHFRQSLQDDATEPQAELYSQLAIRTSPYQSSQDDYSLFKLLISKRSPCLSTHPIQLKSTRSESLLIYHCTRARRNSGRT